MRSKGVYRLAKTLSVRNNPYSWTPALPCSQGSVYSNATSGLSFYTDVKHGPMLNTMIKRLEPTEMWFLWCIMKIPWLVKVFNAAVLQRANVSRKWWKQSNLGRWHSWVMSWGETALSLMIIGKIAGMRDVCLKRWANNVNAWQIQHLLVSSTKPIQYNIIIILMYDLWLLRWHFRNCYFKVMHIYLFKKHAIHISFSSLNLISSNKARTSS